VIREIQAKTLLSSGKQPDPWFGCKYNMNIYRGCEHQCIYCDSRSECYRIENFDDVLVKVNAAELLKKELASKKIKGTIGFGSMSDPYTPAESKYKLTRQALQIIANHKFPIHLITKSSLVLRDKDIIKEINKEFAAITFTITTTDDKLAKLVEPKAPLPTARLTVMKILSDMGIYTGITMMPILPFIEDNPENILAIVREAKKHGAQYIIPALGMTLRDRQREYYYSKLDEHFPNLKRRYAAQFQNRYDCSAQDRRKLRELFYKECKKLNIPTRIKIYKPKSVLSSEQPKLNLQMQRKT